MNKKISIIHIYDTNMNFQILNELRDKFFVKSFNFQEFKTYTDNTIGIVLETQTIRKEHYEALKHYKSLGYKFGVCVISSRFNKKIMQRISLLVQNIYFSTNSLLDESIEMSKTIEMFFSSIEKKNRYIEMLEFRIHNSAMVDPLSIIAHQWRKPLNLISMEAIILLSKASLINTMNSSVVEESAAIIEEQTQRMSDILSTVLRFGNKNRMRIEFSINELLEKLESFYVDDFNSNGIIFHTIKLDQDEYIYGYQIDLEEVLFNLISNVKDEYMKIGNNRDKKIIIKVLSDKNAFVFSVKDEAGGIPKQIKDKIFEAHFSTKGKGKGFGIGLYVARFIIEHEFEGSLSFNTNSLGTEFMITLPKLDIKKIKYINT